MLDIFLRNTSWFGVLHSVMDTSGKLGDRGKSVSVARVDSRLKLQILKCSPNFHASNVE